MRFLAFRRPAYVVRALMQFSVCGLLLGTLFRSLRFILFVIIR
jgi:hypothetical protein